MGLSFNQSLNTDNEQNQRFEETQTFIQQTRNAISAQEALGRINVGYEGHDGKYVSRRPARFNPNQRPQHPPSGREEGFRSWEEVKGHYDNLQAVIVRIAGEYPSIYVLIQSGGDSSLSEATNVDSARARQVITEAFQEVLTNIDATIPKLHSGDLDDRDLLPIHQQLFAGLTLGDSNTNWNLEINKWAAEDLLSDHESTEFWINLGLGTLAAAAFIVANVATLGMASFVAVAAVGVGAGVGLAGRGWEHYFDLAIAADTAAHPELELVTDGQVNAALTMAVLDTVFAFLDVVGVAYRGVRLLNAVDDIPNGSWITTAESMSDAAKQYQSAITRRAWNESFLVNGVKFDGVRNGILLDAKSGYRNFVNRTTGEFHHWFRGADSLANQAIRQLRAANGAKIQWHFQTEAARDATEHFFRSRGINGIELIFTP